MVRRLQGVVMAGMVCSALWALPVSASAQSGGLRAGVRVTQGPWSETLTPAGRLPNDPSHAGSGLENDGGALDAGPVIGGDTLATIGLLSRSDPESVLLVYTKGSAGWSHAGPPARFPFPGEVTDFTVAAANGLVAVNGVNDNGHPPNPACATPVFIAGSHGFSGTLTPAACLAGGVLPVAATPHMVIAESDPSTLQVFTEPAGGWSGTVAPSATLQASDGDDLDAVSMSGSTIAGVEQASSDVDLFTQPAGGWSGTIAESAQIQVPGGAAAATLSGRALTVLGVDRSVDPAQADAQFGVFVTHQPVGGWRSTTLSEPLAYVKTGPSQDTDFGPQQGVTLGETVAFTNILDCGDQGSPPCSTGVWAINGLRAGAAAVPQLPVGPSASSKRGDGTPLTSDGTTLALGEHGIQFYMVAHTPPARVVRASLTGVTAGGGRPVLRLAVAAKGGSAPITSARVLVPTQLGGAAQALVIKLGSPRRTATITLRRLSESPALRRALRRIEAHGGRTVLSVDVELLDQAGRSSQSDVEVTLTR